MKKALVLLTALLLSLSISACSKAETSTAAVSSAPRAAFGRSVQASRDAAVIASRSSSSAAPSPAPATDRCAQPVSASSVSSSSDAAPTPEPTPTPAPISTPTPAPTPAAQPAAQQQPPRQQQTATVSTPSSQQQQSAPATQSRTVYVTATGEKYHYANPCGRGTYYPSTLQDAQARELGPCEKCAL